MDCVEPENEKVKNDYSFPNSLKSQALARLHSLFTVEAERSRTLAVSSTFNPAKNLSSTTLL